MCTSGNCRLAWESEHAAQSVHEGEALHQLSWMLCRLIFSKCDLSWYQVQSVQTPKHDVNAKSVVFSHNFFWEGSYYIHVLGTVYKLYSGWQVPRALDGIMWNVTELVTSMRACAEYTGVVGFEQQCHHRIMDEVVCTVPGAKRHM